MVSKVNYFDFLCKNLLNQIVFLKQYSPPYVTPPIIVCSQAFSYKKIAKKTKYMREEAAKDYAVEGGREASVDERT